MTESLTPVTTVAHVYDTLAPRYDSRYDTPSAHEEDATVAGWLSEPALGSRTILDVGCGTGLLLDLLGKRVSPRRYTGIDPSAGMISRARAKHPMREFVNVSLEDFLTGPKVRREGYDLIVSTFGTPSYIDPEAIGLLPSLLAPQGRLLLMFYEPGYLPDYHDRVPEHIDTSRAAGAALPGAEVTGWSKYWVVTSRGA